MRFTSFKDQFKLRKWKISLKEKSFEVVNSAIRAILLFVNAKNWPPGAEAIFVSKI